jgi:predicted small secreted protein
VTIGPEAPVKTGNRTKAKLIALVAALAFVLAGIGTFLAVGRDDAAPAASSAVGSDFNWGVVDRGGMPTGYAGALVEPGREFTTALDGSALTCTFGVASKSWHAPRRSATKGN